MKKIILTSLFAATVAIQSFGQGQVVLGNSTSSKIWVNAAGPGATTNGLGVVMPANATTSYTFALLAYYTGNVNTSVNTGTTPGVGDNSKTPFSDSNWELVGYGVNGASGRITDPNPFETVPNIPVGDYATMEVIGWNTAVGGSTLASFEAAYAAALADNGANGLLYGVSAEGSILLGNGTVPPNTSVLGTGAGNIPGFTIGQIVSVPEPGTMALAGLGGLSLLAFRRKK
jgi:hypothetical protein